jgi:hypothetical protein
MQAKAIARRLQYIMCNKTACRDDMDMIKAKVYRHCYPVLFATATILVLSASPRAEEVAESVDEPDHIRGQIAVVDDSSITVSTGDGAEIRLGLAESSTILSLSKASFSDVDFGAYVGSISRRLDAYSPIVRDSMSWLHEGYELRVFDEELRGLALGHTTWDLGPDSVITHGWVDDLEIRVLSIKYGPTEEEETDVDRPRDVPILFLKLGDQSLIKPGVHVFAGAQKQEDGDYEIAYVMVGEDGVVPPL